MIATMMWRSEIEDRVWKSLVRSAVIRDGQWECHPNSHRVPPSAIWISPPRSAASIAMVQVRWVSEIDRSLSSDINIISQSYVYWISTGWPSSNATLRTARGDMMENGIHSHCGCCCCCCWSWATTAWNLNKIQYLYLIPPYRVQGNTING